MSLKIKPVVAAELVKTHFKLPVTTVESIEQYKAACAAIYGSETSSDYIVNEILVAFFSSDKVFQNFLKEKKESSKVSD